jgi:hypothetical protein
MSGRNANRTNVVVVLIVFEFNSNYFAGVRGETKARVPQMRSGYVPEHGCAAGFPPRNLLFPAWLPGTVQSLGLRGGVVN